MHRFLSLVSALLFPVVALATPGDLDSTFNGTGTVVTPVLTSDGIASSVVVQSDGKIVAAGSAFNGSNLDFALIRYDATGTLDPAFGGGTGIVTTAIGAGDDQIEALIQQADGKLVAAGLSYDAGFNSSTLTLVRYLEDGTPDPDFGGGDGKVTTAISSSFDGALALIEQTDHKLVVTGYADTDIVVVRYGTGGTPDAMFGGGDGIVRTTIGSSASGNAIVQQASDQKLVVAGVADGQVALVRYDTGGTPDMTFGGDGIVTTTIGDQSEARALVQQASDGKLVIAGIAFASGDSTVMIARYDLDGDPDGNFGTGGVTTTPVGTSADFANAVAEQDDGQLVVAGATLTASHGNDIALVRYDTGGTPDSGFGTSGIVTTTLGDGDDVASAIAIQPNGGIVVAGQKGVGNSTQIAVARYLSLSGTTTSTTTVTTTSSTVATTTSVTTTSAASTTGVPTTSAPTTTSVAATTSVPATTIVTTTVPASTTTTTLASTRLVGGGPASKTSTDCYLELQVAATTSVKDNAIVGCVDGDPCDAGPCGDDRCDFEVAACASQSDPALADCTPPTSLDAAKLSGALASSAGQLLAGPTCGATTRVPVSVKSTKRGTYQANKSRVVIKGNAKAPKGVSPRKDKDKWTLQCLPRTAACPE